MAAICSDGKGRKRIIYTLADGVSRRPLRVGKMSRADASTIAGHVEALVTAVKNNLAPEAKTVEWLAKVSGELRDKLAAAGMCLLSGGAVIFYNYDTTAKISAAATFGRPVCDVREPGQTGSGDV